MCRNRLNRKGFFFQLDVTIAIVILSIGFFVLSSQKVSRISNVPAKQAATNIANLLSDVKLKDICDASLNSCPTIPSVGSAPKINPNNNLIELIGELYSKNLVGHIKNILNDIFTGHEVYNSEIFGIMIKIGTAQIYPSSPVNMAEIEKSTNLISIKKVIYGNWEDIDNTDFGQWGPYLVEITIWRKSN